LKDDFLLVPSLLYLSIIEQLLTGCPLQLEMLEKLENEPFSEFSWKSWKTIGFSPALARKAGIVFLGLEIINSIIR